MPARVELQRRLCARLALLARALWEAARLGDVYLAGREHGRFKSTKLVLLVKTRAPQAYQSLMIEFACQDDVCLAHKIAIFTHRILDDNEDWNPWLENLAQTLQQEYMKRCRTASA